MKDNELFFAELMKRVDLSLFTPSLYNYFMDYLEVEKIRRFGDQFVINSFIPPFPGAAFDRFMSAFFGREDKTPIQSADLAVTNACVFHCWHCYNAARLVSDLPADTLKRILRELQELGVMVVNFTGGEPCLRHDLVDICSALREDSCGVLSTTGYGFTDEMAQRLRETGVYSVAVSLDSFDEKEHDTKRGIKGAFAIALKGIETARKWGFYTYVCTVPSGKGGMKELLTPLVLISGCSTTPCEHWAVPPQLRATLEPEEVEKYEAAYNSLLFRILAGIALSNARRCCPR